MTINLGLRLPEASSSQPEGLGRAPLAPSYLALLRAGFGRPPALTGAGGLLPHHFTLTPTSRGGMFLCHFPSGRPAWELPSALPDWSSDLPPRQVGAATRPTGLLLILAVIGRTVRARPGRLGVQGQVGELIGALVLLAPDVGDREAVELALQLHDALEERAQACVADAVAKLQLAHD